LTTTSCMQVHSRHADEAVTDLQLPHEYYDHLWISESRDSAVGLVRLRAGTYNWGIMVWQLVGAGYIYLFPKRLDRLGGPRFLLVRGYQGLFPDVQTCRGVKLATRLNLLLRLRTSGIFTFAFRYALMVRTGTALPDLNPYLTNVENRVSS